MNHIKFHDLIKKINIFFNRNIYLQQKEIHVKEIVSHENHCVKIYYLNILIYFLPECPHLFCKKFRISVRKKIYRYKFYTPMIVLKISPFLFPLRNFK